MMLVTKFQHKKMTVYIYAGDKGSFILNINIDEDCQIEQLLANDSISIELLMSELKDYLIEKYESKLTNQVEELTEEVNNTSVTMIQTTNGYSIKNIKQAFTNEVLEEYAKGWFLHYSYLQWDKNKRSYKVQSPYGLEYGYLQENEGYLNYEIGGDIKKVKVDDVMIGVLDLVNYYHANDSIT